jgi:hypothetical protein
MQPDSESFQPLAAPPPVVPRPGPLAPPDMEDGVGRYGFMANRLLMEAIGIKVDLQATVYERTRFHAIT